MSGWLKGMRFKLLVLSLVPMLGMLSMGGISQWFANQSRNELVLVAERSVPLMVALEELTLSANGALISIKVIENGWESNKDMSAQLKDLNRFVEKLTSAKAKFDQIPKIDKTDLTYKELKPQLQDIIDLNTKIQQEVALHGVSQRLKDFARSEEYFKSAEKFNDSFGMLGEYVSETTLSRTTAASLAQDQSLQVNFLVLAAIFLVSIVVAFVVSRSLMNTLTQMTYDLDGAGEQIVSASTQLTNSSVSLSSGASTSAASLEESVASMAELSSMVKLNTDHAQQASLLSKKSVDEGARGAQEMMQLSEQMKEISVSSKKVENIIGVIDDIAFQTNLLALNAAVEAARAGEQGRGFAVVAEAVRTLAQKSSASAKEISDLIKLSTQKVQQGVEVAGRSEKALGELVESVKKISDLNEEIATASVEQAKGIDQISTALNSLDREVQGNASTSEEVAATAEQLSAQASSMKQSLMTLSALLGLSKQGARPVGKPKSPPRPEITESKGSGLVEKMGQVIPFKKKGNPATSVGKKSSSGPISSPKNKSVTGSAPKPIPSVPSQSADSPSAEEFFGEVSSPKPQSATPTMMSSDDDFWNDLPRMKRNT